MRTVVALLLTMHPNAAIPSPSIAQKVKNVAGVISTWNHTNVIAGQNETTIAPMAKWNALARMRG